MTDPNQPENRQRLRLTFAKKRAVKYIAHLDLALAWERALRRAQLPLAYSQGFNPRPKMQFASGLPLGTTGSAEILDIVLNEPVDPAAALDQIRPKLPEGIGLSAVEEVPLKAPTLQNLLREAEYRVTVETDTPPDELERRIAALLAADEIIQQRQRKKRLESVNLRPWLHRLAIEQVDNGDVSLFMRLTAGQHGNLRPEAVLEALGLAECWADIERTRLIFEEGALTAP
ncbi:MAG: TIGR03936 family radical SAM-associated protein [Anaerolineae bacterium]